MSTRDKQRARRVIQKRLDAGISLSALAAELGVSKGRLWKVRRGHGHADAELLAKLGVRVCRPRGIRVRMSTTEARAVWFALSSTSHEALRERITMAILKANNQPAKPEAHVNNQ